MASQEDFECGICFNRFSISNKPEILPCLHTFCSYCIKALNERGSVKCAECRLIYKVPAKGFPINSAIQRFMSSFEMQAFQTRPVPTQEMASHSVLEDDMECSICFERFNTPKVLPCQHTFCHTCINYLQQQDRSGNCQCPECRMIFKVPANGFPINKTIQRLLSTSEIKKLPTTVPRNKPAVMQRRPITPTNPPIVERPSQYNQPHQPKHQRNYNSQMNHLSSQKAPLPGHQKQNPQTYLPQSQGRRNIQQSTSGSLIQKPQVMTSQMLQEILECPICLDRFSISKTPKVLPCNHTVCASCLESLNERGIVKCPECRAICQVPANGLPNNITIQRLLSTPEMKNIPTKNVHRNDPGSRRPVIPTAPPL